jgi:hypothetical protein
MFKFAIYDDLVLIFFSMFAELCDTSQKVPAGLLVEQFLDLHQNIQRAGKVVNSLLNTMPPEAIQAVLVAHSVRCQMCVKVSIIKMPHVGFKLQ